jgi:hypothetical protein
MRLAVAGLAMPKQFTQPAGRVRVGPRPGLVRGRRLLQTLCFLARYAGI